MKSGKEQNPGLEDVRSIADSPAGKQLVDLMRSDQDPAVQAAIKQAETGDFSQAKTIIEKLLSSPEAAALIREIRGGK